MTSKQRAYLRGLANTMEPIIHVGKDGVNENMVKQASDALEARELIKGTVLQNSPMTARDAIAALCEGTNAEPVQCIGNPFRDLSGQRERPEDRIAVKTENKRRIAEFETERSFLYACRVFLSCFFRLLTLQ